MQRVYKTIFLWHWLRLLAVVVYTTLLRLFKNPLFRKWLKILTGPAVVVCTTLLRFFKNPLFRKWLKTLIGVGLLCLGVAGILLPFIPGIFFLIPGIHILFGTDIIQIAKRIIRRWRRCGRTPGA